MTETTDPCVNPDLPDPLPDLQHCQSGHAFTCSCGSPLSIVRLPKGDNAWVDESGVSGTIGSPAAPQGEAGLVDFYVRDQGAFWQHLIDTDPATYSRLSAANHLGMWPPRHQHYPESCAHLPHPESAKVPDCHGWPMQSSLDGWRCRQRHTTFAYGVAK